MEVAPPLIAQTLDTDMHEHVRREYGGLEARLLIDKMRDGEIVPKLCNAECMALMLQDLACKTLHNHDDKGFRKVGQHVDSHWQEDRLICREVGAFWNDQTTDGYSTLASPTGCGVSRSRGRD